MQQEKTAFLVVIWSWFLPRHQTGTEGLEIAPLAIIGALQHLEIEPRSHISSEAPCQFTLVPRNHYCPVSSLPRKDWKQSYSAHLSSLFFAWRQSSGLIPFSHHLRIKPNPDCYPTSIPFTHWTQCLCLLSEPLEHLETGHAPCLVSKELY